MRNCGLEWTPDAGLTLDGEKGDKPFDLVMFFGPRSLLENAVAFDALRKAFPSAILVGCSTGGQIVGSEVEDDRICGMALGFSDTRLKLARATRADYGCSRAIGDALAADLAGEDLAGVFVLADALAFDGAALVSGLTERIGDKIPVTGGLAGDDNAFSRTLVAADAQAEAGVACAIGFYGKSVRIGHGVASGWSAFGPRRRITRAVKNVVYELDGKPALDLYEHYLGEEADSLPASGLLFPLRICDPKQPDRNKVRALLAIDREARSITFAAAMPEGWTAQLMRGSLDRLTDVAGEAGAQARQSVEGDAAAILVSCIGRRLLMGQRVRDEVEAVRNALGASMRAVGFYSYGEIAPLAASGFSELHNQTMTVMTISEKAA